MVAWLLYMWWQDFDHNFEEEENFENNTDSSQSQSCHRYMVNKQVCEDDMGFKNELINPKCNYLSSIKRNDQWLYDDNMVVNEPSQE